LLAMRLRNGLVKVVASLGLRLAVVPANADA
jgi:hypothetical protein